MTKKNKKKISSTLIIFIVVISIIVAILYSRTSKDNAPFSELQSNTNINNQQDTKTFQSSSVMKFSIVSPKNYQIIEDLGSVTINIDGGKILIGRNGTNFTNLQDYIENSRNSLKTRILDKKELTIDGLEAILGKVGAEKYYFIYVDGWVYSLSTSSPALFDDLDTIAQSFRYTP